MITILGVQIPVNEKRFTPPQTEVILSYTNAIRDGKETAKRILKM
jgi:hypothetical protein